MLSKYVWSISVKKISFIWSCYGSNKSDGLHNKGPYTRGNIKWRSFALRFCVSNPKSAWQPLLPSAKGLSLLYVLTLCFYFGLESRWSSPFPFSFYPLASSSCLKDHDIYIQLDVSWHRLLLLTSPKGEYVGRQHNKPLSFSVSGWNSITTSTAWVLAIIEDYKIVEYVSLLKSSIVDSFWCYDKLQFHQWLRL